MPDSWEKIEQEMRGAQIEPGAYGAGPGENALRGGNAMPNALELVRGAMDDFRRSKVAGNSGEDWATPFRAGWAKLDAALAEMERDQAFIQAAEAYCAVTDGRFSHFREHAAMMAAYRARREERGKHGVTEEVK